jgi:hyperosmotically inducible periplasmic protein
MARNGTALKRAIVAVSLAVACWGGVAGAENYPADNTGKNVRDRDPGALTAGEQSADKGDVAITQKIRQALVADKDLSTNAQNVKVITKGGVVTLRGPVNTAKEKAAVAAKAKQVAGVRHVNDRLEIASH